MIHVSLYNQRPNRDTLNSKDHVYQGSSLDGAGKGRSGDLTKLNVGQTARHAQASFHMVLDLSKHAPRVPPGGFGGSPPGDWGGPPPGDF